MTNIFKSLLAILFPSVENTYSSLFHSLQLDCVTISHLF